MSDIYNAQTAFQTPSAIPQSAKSMAGLTQNFDDFLKLLTTQLQNQDPLSPMETSEFTNQLVQFSQVEQQIRTNSNLETLVTLQDLSLTSIALGYIGMDVLVEGSRFDHTGGSYNFRYELPAGGANSVEVSILDDQNQLVAKFQGGKNGGRNDVTWDGRDSQGNLVDPAKYRISIKAVDAEGKTIAAKTSVTVRIDGLDTVDGQLLLTAKDMLVPFGSISAVSLPPTNQPQS